MDNNILLTGRQITKKYHMGEVDVVALRGVDIDVRAGEFIVVLGPSGSGKSTLLNIIGGMDNATSGELYYGDTPLHNASERRLTVYRREVVGFVFQFYNLMPNLTALENVKLSAEISPNPLPPAEMLEAVDLSDRAGHFPAQLSGGQQQRVAIARALAKNPQILLCDEPTGALDISTGLQVLRILKQFHQKYRKTVIIITHNASIGGIGDRVLYFKDGLIDHIQVNEHPMQPDEVEW